MSDLNYEDLLSVLNEKLRDFGNVNGYDISWEEIEYVPTVGTTYLSQFFLLGESDAFRKGNRELGIYQINVNVSLNAGRGVALRIVDSIRSYFPRTLSISGKCRVGIVKSYMSSPQRDGSWYAEILNFQWEAM